MYNLKEIFEQAWKDKMATRGRGIDDRCVWQNGVKITKSLKDEDSYFIENTGLVGSYYTEITQEQLKVFKEDGWKIGVYKVNISNFEIKMDSINRRINKLKSNKIIDETKKELMLDGYNQDIKLIA